MAVGGSLTVQSQPQREAGTAIVAMLPAAAIDRFALAA
jgi:signal transduction histidine kinase